MTEPGSARAAAPGDSSSTHSSPEPLLVAVTRGGVIESRHRVHAVAVAEGRVTAYRGDPQLVCFLRSAAKPLQALVLARSRGDLDERDLAIASSSHAAAPDQLAAVRALLARAPATAAQLQCTAAADADAQLRHMCSGKHAGMLAACVAHGWPLERYRERDHPLQRAILDDVAALADVPVAAIRLGSDGCGVPTLALELWQAAKAFAQLETTEAGARVASGIRAHPELISDPSAPDFRLMRKLPGWIAKAGVEGVLAAAGPHGCGIAFKVEDGNARALEPAAIAFATTLGIVGEACSPRPVRNGHEEATGEIVVAA